MRAIGELVVVPKIMRPAEVKVVVRVNVCVRQDAVHVKLCFYSRHIVDAITEKFRSLPETTAPLTGRVNVQLAAGPPQQ